MKPYRLLLTIILPLATSSVAVDGMTLGGSATRGLCQPDETVLFECTSGRRMIAVCGGHLSTNKSYAQYRFGRPGKLELEYPTRREDGPGDLSLGSHGYSGGGESQISFSSDGFRYVAYSRTIRTRFAPDGRHDPKFEAGVFVKRGGRMLSDRKCTDPSDANIDEVASRKFLPAGPFVEPWDE